MSAWCSLARGPSFRCSVLVGTLSLVALALAVGIVYWERTHALEQETTRAANLAHALEQQTGRTFQAVDLTLVGIATPSPLRRPCALTTPTSRTRSDEGSSPCRSCGTST